jgi:adenylate cyclase
MRFKGSDQDVRTIAHEVGVRYVLEGGVRTRRATRCASRRVSLMRTGTSNSGRGLSQAPSMMYSISGAVGARYGRQRCAFAFPRVSHARMAKKPIARLRARTNAYLRARHEAWRFSREGLESARRHIDTALAIVGDNELLYGTLGHITAMYREAGIETGDESVERIDQLADRVFALNPDSARGHFLEMFVAYTRGYVRGAIRAGERAHARLPDDADTLLFLGYIYARVGRNAEARSLLERALQLDPLTTMAHGVQGFLAILEGRYGDATRTYRRCVQMDPYAPWTYGALSWALAYDRQPGEAIATCDAVLQRFPGTVFAAAARCFAHALRGESEAAVRAVTPALEAAAHSNELFARELAHSYALAGDNERALQWLERAVDLGMLNYAYLAQYDWFLDGVRAQPRFHALLDRVRRASVQLVRT